MSTDPIAPDPITLANRAQAEASDPSVSVFVSASAGSGKTKLLIDRLLRLMLPRPAADGTLLPGSDPSRIQCLTFTNAAAAEMSIRLQAELGRWVTLDDAALDMRLSSLGLPAGDAVRRSARALFARVLDLPGGMRISTIHAFCQSLLRRFPLEASISPHFQLAEETDSRLALIGATESVLAGRPVEDAALEQLARQVGVGDFTELVSRLHSRMRRGDLIALRAAPLREAPLREALGRAAGITHDDEAVCVRDGVTGADEKRLRAMLLLALERGTDAARKAAQARLDWLAKAMPARQASWADWCGMMLTSDGEPHPHRGFTKAKWLNASPEIVDALLAESERVFRIEDERRTIRIVGLTAALLDLALPILDRHALQKRDVSQLDYDDLIARTLALLDDPGVAWVLYKLDGGIDHLLLDEVQDTSPLQWQIAWALTGEFFAGAGAGGERRLPRTMFAVGDYKQSIYSFQGADPSQFHGWRQRFRDRVRAGGGTWLEPSLNVSFRSVEPVLRLVDAVFAAPEASRGLVEPGQTALPAHRASRIGAPGRVELWPLTPVGEAAGQPGAWEAPRRNEGQDSAPQRLAETLARWIAGEIGAADPHGGEPLRAGDVLILVPRRSAFARALIRALKSEDVPVATLVRTGLVDQIAVQDLLALCEALLLPQDDLTVACVLTSPLGGLTDDQMMALATTRDGATLWDSLRARHQTRPDWERAWRFLSALFARVDYATPHALLGEALGALGGRARLLARLGPEAAEPVDELLAACLRFEAAHPPSLQGFVHWLRHSEEGIKREPDSAGDAVRVMTVHGAKGLQARLVVLPDTTSVPAARDRLFWTRDPQTGAELPLWVPLVSLASTPTRSLSDKVRRELLEERNRLLYVALTRASDRLLVCGWTQSVSMPEGAWYGLCRQGFERAGAVATPFDLGWDGERLVLDNGAVLHDVAAPGREAGAGRAAKGRPIDPEAFKQGALKQGALKQGALKQGASLPAWLGSAPGWQSAPPPAEPALPQPLAPSRPDGVEFGTRPAARSPLLAVAGGSAARREAGLARGRLVHSLLQHLPALPEAERERAARSYAARPAFGLQDGDAARLVATVMAVLDDPALAALFGPPGRAEQPLAGVANGVVVTGQVDRMLVLPDRVLLCDFKTGWKAPSQAADVPVAILRQMAAYRALLEQLYPGRTLECLVVWTEGPSVMTLPATLLDMHRPGVRPVLREGVPA